MDPESGQSASGGEPAPPGPPSPPVFNLGESPDSVEEQIRRVVAERLGGDMQGLRFAARGERSERQVFDLDQPPAQIGSQIRRMLRDEPERDAALDARGVGAAKAVPIEEQRARAQDNTRKTIALWFIGLFTAIVILSFASLYILGLKNGFDDKTFFEHLKTLLDVLGGPLITLLSSAVGFYFGSQQAANQRAQPAVAPPPPPRGGK